MYYRYFLFFFIFAFSFCTIFGQILPSNITEESKQILILKQPILYNDSAFFEPDWLSGLRQKIQEAINRYGYKDAKQYIEQYVEETEKNSSVLLHVKVNKEGLASVEHKPIMKSRAEAEVKPEPEWMKDLKYYVKALINVMGKDAARYALLPMVKAIEFKHNVKINDIDVNELGEVVIHYQELALPKIYGSRKRKHKKQKRKQKKLIRSSDQDEE